jgi:hypothetical protein
MEKKFFTMRRLIDAPRVRDPVSRLWVTSAPLLRLHFISTQESRNGDEFADPTVLLLYFHFSLASAFI